MHKVMDVAQRIGQVEIKLLGAEGIIVRTHNYPAAGQTVMHFHVHVIPCYEEKKEKQIEMKPNPEGLNLPALAQDIKNNL